MIFILKYTLKITFIQNFVKVIFSLRIKLIKMEIMNKEIKKKGMIGNGRLKPNGITTFKTSNWST